MEQAAQIVVSEIETLERRVRAFSEFASEPPVNPEPLDLNALVTERVVAAEAGASRDDLSLSSSTCAGPRVHAGADLVKGILTNLLENAAEAAGPGGIGRDRHAPAGRPGRSWKCTTRVPASARRRRARCSSRRSRSRSTAWASGCRSPGRTRCCSGGDITLVDGRARRRRVPRHRSHVRPSAGPSDPADAHDPQTSHRHRRRRAEHRPVAAADPRGRGLRA